MVELKIKAGDLSTLLQLIACRGIDVNGKGGVPILDDCLLQIKQKGILGRNMDENEVLLSMIKFTVETSVLGDVPLKLAKTIDTVKRFNASDEVKFEYDEESNKLILTRAKPKLQYVIACIPVEDLQSSIGEHVLLTYNSKLNCWLYSEDKIAYNVYVKMKSDQLKEIAKDGELFEYRSYLIKILPNSFEVTISNEETGEKSVRELVTSEIKMPGKTQAVSSLYSGGFGQLFNQLSGEIELWFASESQVNSALIVRQSLTNFDIVYMLCSVSMEEETSKDEPNVSENNETIQELPNTDTNDDTESSWDDFDGSNP